MIEKNFLTTALSSEYFFISSELTKGKYKSSFWTETQSNNWFLDGVDSWCRLFTFSVFWGKKTTPYIYGMIVYYIFKYTCTYTFTFMDNQTRFDSFQCGVWACWLTETILDHFQSNVTISNIPWLELISTNIRTRATDARHRYYTSLTDALSHGTRLDALIIYQAFSC